MPQAILAGRTDLLLMRFTDVICFPGYSAGAPAGRGLCSRLREGTSGSRVLRSAALGIVYWPGCARCVGQALSLRKQRVGRRRGPWASGPHLIWVQLCPISQPDHRQVTQDIAR